MKGRTKSYPVIFEKTTLGNYRIVFPDLNAKFQEQNEETLQKIYYRRTKQHITDMDKIHIEYIEVEEKVY